MEGPGQPVVVRTGPTREWSFVLDLPLRHERSPVRGTSLSSLHPPSGGDSTGLHRCPGPILTRDVDWSSVTQRDRVSGRGVVVSRHRTHFLTPILEPNLSSHQTLTPFPLCRHGPQSRVGLGRVPPPPGKSVGRGYSFGSPGCWDPVLPGHGLGSPSRSFPPPVLSVRGEVPDGGPQW